MPPHVGSYNFNGLLGLERRALKRPHRWVGERRQEDSPCRLGDSPARVVEADGSSRLVIRDVNRQARAQ